MKTIATIILTVIAVLFSIQNFDRVPVRLLWGNPIEMQLIFIIAIAGISGYLLRYFIGIRKEDELKRRFREFAEKKTRKRSSQTEFDQEDL
jgi:uncharacterized integral membrane protein